MRGLTCAPGSAVWSAATAGRTRKTRTRGESDAEDDDERKAEAERASRDPEAVAGEGPADVCEGPRQRRRGVRRGRAGAPHRLRGAEALVREGRRPLGAQVEARALRPAGPPARRAGAL